MKPIILNNLEFALKHESISGAMTIEDCPRLIGQVVHRNQAGAYINYALTGKTEQFDAPSLHLDVDARLNVVCQRCLEPMPINLTLALHYVVTNNAPAAEDDLDAVDWLEASKVMNLNELMEDELLLALPIAPMHEESCAHGQMESGAPSHPFAALKQLIK